MKRGIQLKTRIISGFIAAVLVLGLFILNAYFDITLLITVSIISALAVYEMLKNTGCVKNIVMVLTAMVYTATMQFALLKYPIDPALITFVYLLVVVCFAVFDHEHFAGQQITMAVAMPIILAFAFHYILKLTDTSVLGYFYFILLLNFSCVADIFAYFVGRAIGKHKLAPVVSPKKTIEGSVGGAIGTCIGTVAICLVFEQLYSDDINILLAILITPFMSIIGMLGDLVMSAIKRTYGIKDYGNIMPGHGGVLDRVDSVLLVAPALAIFLSYFPLV